MFQIACLIEITLTEKHGQKAENEDHKDIEIANFMAIKVTFNLAAYKLAAFQSLVKAGAYRYQMGDHVIDRGPSILKNCLLGHTISGGPSKHLGVQAALP